MHSIKPDILSKQNFIFCFTDYKAGRFTQKEEHILPLQLLQIKGGAQVILVLTEQSRASVRQTIELKISNCGAFKDAQTSEV